MIVINYSNYTNLQEVSDLCKTDTVVFDFKLYDIPSTMRRNISKSVRTRWACGNNSR